MLATIAASSLKQPLLWCLHRDDLLAPLFLHLLVGNPVQGRVLPSPFMCLFSYLYLYGLGYLGYSVGHNPFLSLFIVSFYFSFTIYIHYHWFLCSNCCRFGHSGWLLGAFSVFLLYFEHVLTFWNHRIFQIYLVLSLPQTWQHPFCQGALVPFGNWDLEAEGCLLMPGCHYL